MTEVTVAMSRKVLTESNLDASILSSVVGSYDDQNRSGLTSFMQQGSSSSHSDSSPRASNLFNTLLRLMEPTYVRLYLYSIVCNVCVYVCYVCVCTYVCMYVCVWCLFRIHYQVYG